MRDEVLDLRAELDAGEILDDQALSQLKALEDPADSNDHFLDELIDMFKRETRPLVVALESQVRARDFRQVEYLAHKLKGYARNLGAKCLAASCEEIETSSRTMNDQVLRTATQKIGRVTEATIALLEANWRSKVVRSGCDLPHAVAG